MRIKILLLAIFFFCGFHVFSLFCLHFNETFHPKFFAHGFEKNYSQDVSGLDAVILDEIFQQPFHYLAQGKQMTTFVSTDQKYVLKLFNPMRPLKKGWHKKIKYWKRCSSLKWISREWFGKKLRLQKLFLRHKIAFENIRDETGLVYVHLSPSDKIPHKLHIMDKEKRKHQLALHNTPFILQERAILVPIYLNQLLENDQIEDAKNAIKNIEKLFVKRIEKAITDRIQTMDNNYGFVGAKPIQLDVGRIQIDPLIKKFPDKEQNRIFRNFHNWLNEKYPRLQ